MAVTDTEANVLFNYALGHVRAGGLNATGKARVDQTALVRRMWERFNGVSGYRHADMVNAVKRAVGAREGANRMQTDRFLPGALTAHNYPHNPVMNLRRGRYEYRVIVRVSGNGQSFDWPVTLQTRNRLSGDEVLTRAERLYTQDAAAQQSYRNAVQSVGSAPQLDGLIISATRHQPDSYF